MSLSSLSAKTDYTYDGRPIRVAVARRSTIADPSESKGAPPIAYPKTPPPAQPFDSAFYASRFKADLSQLKAF